MLYCSSQHQTLLSPPDTFTSECHFHFGPVTLFFLDLLVIDLCSYPVAYWTPSDLGALIFWCHILLPFHTVAHLLVSYPFASSYGCSSSGVISFCLLIRLLIFWCHILLPFHTVHWILTARMLEWFAIPSSSGPLFVRTLHHDLSVLGGPYDTAHGFTELCKPHHHDKTAIHEGVGSFA